MGVSDRPVNHSPSCGPQEGCTNTGQSMGAWGLPLKLHVPPSLQLLERILGGFIRKRKYHLSQCPLQGVMWHLPKPYRGLLMTS